MFMGEYQHNVDAKGRVIIPAKFREELGQTFILTKGLDKCLVIYTMEEWKVFEEKITSKDFDFIGLVGQLEEFGRKHRISQKTIYRIQQIFEEICVQIILPELSGDFNLNLAVEYSPETEEVTMRFVYDGKEFNPLNSDNQLSLQIASRAADSINYEYLPQEGKNTVAIIISAE